MLQSTSALRPWLGLCHRFCSRYLWCNKLVPQTPNFSGGWVKVPIDMTSFFKPFGISNFSRQHM